MPRTQKYFVGPNLLGDIRRVVERVSAEPYRSEVARIPTRLQDMRRGGGGGGGITLGRVTATWNKNTLQNVIVHSGGTALAETTASPPEFIEACVNKFVDVDANKWVMVGRTNGRWYLISAEC